MIPSPAELSSLATALEELTTRVTGMVEAFTRAARDDVASDLAAVEQSLTTAHRRLAEVVDRNGP